MCRCHPILVALLLAGCAAAPKPAGYSVETGVRYAGAEEGGDPRIGDVYRPDSPGPRPAVLLIHGGSWRSGDRSHMDKFAVRYARAGYAVYNVNYRLAPEHRFPAQQDDVRAAFRWLHAHAGSLSVDPDRIAVMGYSAGAHLALLLALADAGGGPVPRAAIAGAAPTDLREYPSSPVIAALIGGPGDALPDEYAQASPIAHVSADDPPVLLYHGALDLVVEVEQSRRLVEALRAAGVTAELVEEPWSGHTSAYFFDGDSFEAALAFLGEQMR
jgi:acetyl esterase/lipase